MSASNPILRYNAADMAGRPPNTPSTETGARLAAFRKEAGLSQVQLAEAVGIPQRTVSFYERHASSLPSRLVPKLAEALGVSVEAILGLESKTSKAKRGPSSKLEQVTERLARLPRGKQSVVLEMLEGFLEKAES